jgi:hypothetical protein
MFRTLIVVLVTCLLGAGCGGDGNSGDSAASDKEQVVNRTVSEPPQGESRPMIPAPLEVVEGVTLSLYFDEAGTETEKSVAPGEQFSLFVTAEYKDPYHINAAEYRIGFPDGVEVIGSSKFTDHSLTVGSWETDFSMAFECRPPGKFYLMKYTCTAGPEFSGGKIEITPGVKAAGISFLGFVSCKPKTEKLPVNGGSVTLARK